MDPQEAKPSSKAAEDEGREENRPERKKGKVREATFEE